jgi:hypothetical protein
MIGGNKRIAKALAAVILLISVTGLLVVLTQSTSENYFSDVFVSFQPFNSDLLEPKFEKEIKKTVAGISALHFQRSAMINFQPNGTTTTNSQVVIQLVATGNTASAAISNANRIAPLFCYASGLCFTNARIAILNPAVGASNKRQNGWSEWLRFGKRKDFEPTRVAGAVSFVNIGLSLMPGPDWEQHYSAIPYPPTLIRHVNEGGDFLSACLIGNNQPDIETAALVRRKSVTAAASAVTPPKEETFTTDSGLFVVKTYYSQIDFSRGTSISSDRSDYFTTNAAGQIVMISHVAISADRPNEVHKMIARSLKPK